MDMVSTIELLYIATKYYSIICHRGKYIQPGQVFPLGPEGRIRLHDWRVSMALILSGTPN